MHTHTHNPELESILSPLHKISKDMMQAIRKSGGGFTTNEARFLVDLYYQMQKQRIILNNQAKGLDRDAKKAEREAEPHDAIDFILLQSKTLEDQVKRILAVYVEMHPMQWFFAQTLGIGPVLAAGLLANIDIHKAPTAGHIWNFAGLNPGIRWKKGEKRPFNAQLKTLCWKIGDSFVKLSGRDDAYYGKVYRQRKEREVEKNERLEFADKAAAKLENCRIGKDTDAFKHYSEGKLPPAHIDQRARRYAVKLFLSHLQQRWHEQEIGPVPKPFAVAHLGHAHVIEPPQKP